MTSSGAAASPGGSRPRPSIADAGPMTLRRVSSSEPSLSAVDRLLRYTIMNGRNDVNRKSCNGTSPISNAHVTRNRQCASLRERRFRYRKRPYARYTRMSSGNDPRTIIRTKPESP